MDNWFYYVAALVVIVLAVYIIKKVASCLMKTVIFLVGLAALGAGYWLLISNS